MSICLVKYIEKLQKKKPNKFQWWGKTRNKLKRLSFSFLIYKKFSELLLFHEYIQGLLILIVKSTNGYDAADATDAIIIVAINFVID